MPREYSGRMPEGKHSCGVAVYCANTFLCATAALYTCPTCPKQAVPLQASCVDQPAFRLIPSPLPA